MNALSVATATKMAAREARRLLGRPMATAEWKWDGTYEVVAEVRPGWWRVVVPRSNPLRLVHVPSGMALVGAYREMETDFASVPDWAQKIGATSKALNLNPRDYEPAVFTHDQDYEAAWCWAVWKGRAVKVDLTKTQADAKLYVGLECLGATQADGFAYHGAVSLCGGAAWRRCRRKRAQWPELFEERDERKA